MNRIFKVIKNACGQYVVVSEFAKQSGKNKALKLLLPLATFSTMASASIVSDIVPYEEYRNFAENKGKYTVGATDIPIYDKNNILLGNLFPDVQNRTGDWLKIPMPDFSPSHSVIYNNLPHTIIHNGVKGWDFLGVSTLVHPQYVTTVKHNGIKSPNRLEFGDIFSFTKQGENYQYFITNANDAEPDFRFKEEDDYFKLHHKYDFSLPRLSKLVTEVIPTETINGEDQRCLLDSIELSWDCHSSESFTDRKWGHIVRLGGGMQYVYSAEEDDQNLEYISSAYNYLTGGSILGKSMVKEQNGNYFITGGKEYPVTLKDGMTREKVNRLPTVIARGDSGSPLYVYDFLNKKWKLAGLASSAVALYRGTPFARENENINNIEKSSFTVYKPEFLNRYLVQHKGVELNLGGEEVSWRATEQGKSIIADNELAVSLSDDIAGAENGKDLYINGGAIDGEQLLQPLTINLESDIDQGAGGIYVGNIRPSYVKIKTDNDSSWVGSGIVVHKGSVLDWQVNQPLTARSYEKSYKQDINFSGDRLSKLGQGTLRITGSNPRPTPPIGHLSIGDGQVIIDVGNEPAFHNIELVSGRGVLTLSDAQSMNNSFGNHYWEDSYENSGGVGGIRFGYRGGKLDLNGKNASAFAVDEGANIVNHNINKTSTFHLGTGGVMPGLIGSRGYSVFRNPIVSLDEQGMLLGQKYYQEGVLDYDYGLFSENGWSSEDLKLMKDSDTLSRLGIPSWWGIGGSNLELYKQQFELVGDQYFNGKINVNVSGGNHYYNSHSDDKNNLLLLSGGLNLNGDFNVTNGKVIFSGYQVPFADKHPTSSSTAEIEEVRKDNEWLTRNFVADKLKLDEKSSVEIGRNVGAFVLNEIELRNNSRLSLGFNNGISTICYSGKAFENSDGCSVRKLDEQNYKNLPHTFIYVKNGIVALSYDAYSRYIDGKAEINIGKAVLYSGIGREGSPLNVTLARDAIWQLASAYTVSGSDSGSSTSYVNELRLEQGSKIYLNSENEFNKFNKLVVGSLSGNGFFRFNTNLAKLVGNLVEVTNAAGSHTISILDSGEEIKRENAETLKLFDIKGNNSATFKLEKGYVDAGAFRYYLNNLKNLVQLDTSEEAKNQADADLNKAQEEADRQRQAEEERKRQEEADRQRQAEEERKRQEEADRQRQVEEERKRQQEEADRQRQAEERKRQEEAERQRQAEEERKHQEEADRQRQAEEERKRQEEAERQRQAEEERKRQEEAERQRQAEEERKRQEEAERKRQEEAERQRQAEEERKRQEEAERQRQAEEERKRQEEAERQRQAEEERKRQEEAERQRQAEEERKRQQEEADRQRQAEEERKRQEEAERKRQEEAERKRQEEAERQRQEEADRQRQAEEERKRQEEADRQRQAEEERKRQEEADRQRQAEEERKRQEEAERQRQAEEERKRQEEAERQRQAEEERKRQEEAERQRQAEEERKRQEEAERQRQAEEERKRQEEAERQRQAEEERKRQEEADRQRQAEEERKRQEEAERQRQAEEERKRQEEADRQRQAEEERKRQEEADRQRQVEEERKRQEEAERQRQAEEERKRQEEAERQRQAEEERKLHEEADRQRQAEEERKRQEEAERQRQAEEERKRQEEADRQRQAEEERKRQEEAERQRQAEEERKRQEEADRQRQEEEERKRQAEEERKRQEEADRQRQVEEERKRQEEAERQRQAEAERQGQIESKRKSQEEAERQGQIESERKSQEEAEHQGQVEEERKRQEKLQKERISKYTNTAVSDLAVSIQSITNAGDSIRQHLTNTNVPKEYTDVWVNTKSLNGSYHSDNYRDYSTKGKQNQIGADFRLSDSLVAGVALTESKGSHLFADSSSEQSRLRMLSSYAKYQLPSGEFAAVDISWGKLKNKISQGGQLEIVNRNLTQVGLTAGKAFNLTNLEIKPFAGVRYSYLSKAAYQQSGASIETDSSKVMSYLMGVNVGYTLKVNQDLEFKPLVSWSYAIHNSHNQIKVNGYNFNLESDKQHTVDAGLAVKFKNIQLDVLGGISQGKQMGKQKRFSANLSISF
ncbi:autotransporter domain-containing protein [Ursidibacter maritimus]|uniref:S6 family peptidase n=1 Tax=Ursidibacter maritimus TaxID=1331689 RepID=UPI001C44D932|nr:S6 family peptidase [Ursidibacter maritimus]MBV6536833.1 autotransporter domain-containing protein [Ursidibacter maritimus]